MVRHRVGSGDRPELGLEGDDLQLYPLLAPPAGAEPVTHRSPTRLQQIH